MKKIAITAWTGMTVRNILFSPTYTELIKHFDVTIFSPYSDQLRNILARSSCPPTLAHLPIPRWWMSRSQGFLTRLLYRWNYYAFWESKKPASLEKWISKERRERPVVSRINRIGGHLVNKLRTGTGRDILRDSAYFLPFSNTLRNFDAFLLCSTDILNDQMLLYSCKKAHVPVAVLVHSWDNLPSRGLLSANPDRLLVWNECMLNEATTLHDISEKTIDIVGVPQHELYRTLAKPKDNSAFLERYKVTETTKVITYTGSPHTVFPDEPIFIDTLISSISRGVFGNAVLIFRLHPTERRRFYSNQFASSTLPIRLDVPDDNFSAENTRSIGDPKSITHFVELLENSDVVINLASTISLDAILFGKPVVCPMFNLGMPASTWNSAQRWYETSHFSRLTTSSAISFPKTFESLVFSIQEAINVSNVNQTERNNIVQTMMPQLPTSKLISDAIYRCINRT